MIKYNSDELRNGPGGLRSITFADKTPYTAAGHIRKWLDMREGEHDASDHENILNIRDITQITDGKMVYTTVWFTIETVPSQDDTASK